jgi:UDP-glucose 4-epimerase
MYQRSDKVVVTGGAGFIGSHLVDRLLAETDSQVIVLDNLHRGRLTNLARHAEEPRLHVLQGDVRDVDLVTRTVRGADVVYHLAAQSTVVGALDDLDYSFSTNVVGTFNVLRAAAHESVRRVVFASSREVYGEPIELPVHEGLPLHAINFYGASKVMGEAYCRAFRRTLGLDSVILRVTNAYGPRDFGRVIPRWAAQAAEGKQLTVYGGKQVLDFVWIGQVVEALHRAAELEGPTPPINIGSGTGTRIVDLAKRIRIVAGSHSQLQLLPARSAEVVHFVARVDRMRQALRIAPPADPLVHLPEVVPSRIAALS